MKHSFQRDDIRSTTEDESELRRETNYVGIENMKPKVIQFSIVLLLHFSL